MKNIFLAFAVLFATALFAQDSTNVKAEAPKVVSKLKFGKVITVENLEFKFVKVETDSRCPSDVTCIWAGEAIVLVDVFENGKKIEQKRLVFSPKNRLKNEIGNLFTSETLNISGVTIEPYPTSRKKITPEDYFINLDVR